MLCGFQLFSLNQIALYMELYSGGRDIFMIIVDFTPFVIVSGLLMEQ